MHSGSLQTFGGSFADAQRQSCRCLAAVCRHSAAVLYMLSGSFADASGSFSDVWRQCCTCTAAGLLMWGDSIAHAQQPFADIWRQFSRCAAAVCRHSASVLHMHSGSLQTFAAVIFRFIAAVLLLFSSSFRTFCGSLADAQRQFCTCSAAVCRHFAAVMHMLSGSL